MAETYRALKDLELDEMNDMYAQIVVMELM